MIEEIASDEELRIIEEELLTHSLLKLRNIPKNYYKSRRKLELMVDDIIWKNITHDTLYVSNGLRQCDCWHRRSQGDLFRIVKYYRPEVTFKEFRQALFNLVNSERLITSYCPNIRKRVFHKRNRYRQNQDTVYHSTTIDEFGLTLMPHVDMQLVTDWNGTTLYILPREIQYYNNMYSNNR
jgi:hypothetical protein